MNKIFYSHAIIPLLLFTITVIGLNLYNLDIPIADYLYRAEGAEWQLKDHWLTEDVIHKGGRIFVGVLLIITLSTLALSFFIKKIAAYRLGIIYIICATLSSLIIVSFLKNATHIPCPWNYTRYGGEHIYIPLFDVIWGSSSVRCFPSGHASGGYAWVCLYFFCLAYAPTLRFKALITSLVLGATFGIAQQLRGAHFLSHDVWTLCLCWYTSLFYYWLLLKKKNQSFDLLRQPAQASVEPPS